MQEMIERYGKQAGHMLKEFDLDEGKSISKEEFIAVLDEKCQKDAARMAKWVKFLAKPLAKKEKKAPTDAPAAASSGADTMDKATLAKQPVGICHDDCSEFESVIAEVRAECRIAKCGFPTTVVVKDVPPVPEAELEAFKATHLSNEYLHWPEAEDLFKNDVNIQHGGAGGRAGIGEGLDPGLLRPHGLHGAWVLAEPVQGLS
jgi:hypothetical protein